MGRGSARIQRDTSTHNIGVHAITPIVPEQQLDVFEQVSLSRCGRRARLDAELAVTSPESITTTKARPSMRQIHPSILLRDPAVKYVDWALHTPRDHRGGRLGLRGCPRFRRWERLSSGFRSPTCSDHGPTSPPFVLSGAPTSTTVNAQALLVTAGRGRPYRGYGASHTNRRITHSVIQPLWARIITWLSSSILCSRLAIKPVWSLEILPFPRPSTFTTAFSTL
jgi:hypothetical protein